MKNYQLSEDEVVLFKGFGALKDKRGVTEIILTNHNIVFVTRYKKFLSEEEVNIETYPLEDIKMYQGVPQVKTKGAITEIYLRTTEKEYQFDSRLDIHKFMSALMKLFTGKTAVERGAEKVKSSIKLVDDTLGIDSVHMVGDAVKDGVAGKVSKGFNKVIGKMFKK